MRQGNRGVFFAGMYQSGCRMRDNEEIALVYSCKGSQGVLQKKAATSSLERSSHPQSLSPHPASFLSLTEVLMVDNMSGV